MPLLVASTSTFVSVGDTAIVQYHGTVGTALAEADPTPTAGAAAVGDELETAPIAANAATHAATSPAATSLLRVNPLIASRPGRTIRSYGRRRRARTGGSPRTGPGTPAAPARPRARSPRRTRPRRRSSGLPREGRGRAAQAARPARAHVQSAWRAPRRRRRRPRPTSSQVPHRLGSPRPSRDDAQRLDRDVEVALRGVEAPREAEGAVGRGAERATGGGGRGDPRP